MEIINSDKFPCIRKTRILFQKLGLHSSKSEVIYDKNSVCKLNSTENEDRNETCPDFMKNSQGEIGTKRKTFLSTKIKDFRIPGVENFKYNKRLNLKKNLSSTDGFVIHKFSIPNGLLVMKKKNASEKGSIDYSQILNPNLKPFKKGPSGFKIYSSTKTSKKFKIQLHSYTPSCQL